MHLHRSNRSERLVEALAEVVRRPLGGITDPEWIVVESKGMERWLSMQLAERFGVWANPSFPFPRTVVETTLGSVLEEDPEATSPFSEDTLLWSIAELLETRCDDPAFDTIRRYFDGDDGLRIQLAQRVAETFDNYSVYRPEMVLGWEAGDDDHWQAHLWRRLVAKHAGAPAHQATRARLCIERLDNGEGPVPGLPERLTLFGISTLPRLHLQVFAALSRRIEVHMCLLSPSRLYWGHIRNKREILRELSRRGADTEEAEAELHLEEGHPLLASMGRLGREFQQLLEGSVEYRESDELYEEPAGHSLLATLQADMLDLRPRGGKQPRARLATDDQSIQIHDCHGPMREVQVLHDQIIAFLEEDETLHPRDIVVMTPQIDVYAPVIDAVFGSDAPGERIPYRVSDRGVFATHEVVDAFYAVMESMQSRMEASVVLDLLGAECVRARFDIVEEELETLRVWVKDSGIRWGVDIDHRHAESQPAYAGNTWRFGLDRLMLGYAMEGDGGLYEGMLPFDDIEGGAAALLGKLHEFCDALFERRCSLSDPRTAEQWQEDLTELLAAMVSDAGTWGVQHELVRDGLLALSEQADRGGFAGAVDLTTLRRQLDRTLDRRLPAHGFMSGGVTFCQLVPMRSIPFRVVCMIGMNDEAFPSSERPYGFDLMAQSPRAGDRSRRNVDRYLFLEALLAARDRVIISHVGQGIHDNRVIPPSVVVNELIDVVREGFEAEVDDETRRAMERRLVVTHRLQPFNPAYFGGDDRLFSYGSSHCAGATVLARARHEAVDDPGFIEGRIGVSDPKLYEISLVELENYLSHPIRTFLQRRLGLYLGGDLEVIEDREPISLNKLEQWKLGTASIQEALESKGQPDREALRERFRASGSLPLGTPGELAYGDVEPTALAIAKGARELSGGRRRLPLSVDFNIGKLRVRGDLRDVHDDCQVRAQYSSAGRRAELVQWIRHLVLNLVVLEQGAVAPRHSAIFGRGPEGMSRVDFRQVDAPRPILEDLADLLCEAMERPLPFLDAASRGYASVFLESSPGDHDASILKARTEFDKEFGDHRDDYVAQVFSDFDEVLEERGPTGFVAATTRVYGQMFGHREPQ